MPEISITDLTARMRHDFEPSNSFAKASLSDVMNAAADALEASEQRANAAEREMHARELHHFESEELLAAAQATIAEALRQTRRGNIATPPWVIEALNQSPTDALEAVKHRVWREGFDAGERDVMQHEESTFYTPCVPSPYRAATTSPGEVENA